MRHLILCAVTHDDHAPAVVRTARGLAATGDFDVVFVHVAEPAFTMPPTAAYHPALPAAAGLPDHDAENAVLERCRDVVQRAGVRPDEHVVTAHGRPPAELRRLALELGADLIVAGMNRSGRFTGTLLGSVSRQLLRESPCPVLLAHDDRVPEMGAPVVCGVEGEDGASRAAVATATRLADALDAPLEIVRGGAIVDELLRASTEREASVVVVGSHGEGALKTALVGTIPVELTRAATGPVVVAPEAS